MPTFGQHETAQRLFLSGVGGLYALKADDAKVVKVLQPPEGIWSDEMIRQEIEGFIQRARTQKKLAETSRNWAPVHEAAAIRQGTEGSSGGGEPVSGSAEAAGDLTASGAYAVLDRYERSAQSLIDGRVNLNNDDLRNIMSGIIGGLIDIRRTGRGHGNLKASNVLLANAANLGLATVHLTDPAADGTQGAASQDKDLTDLGKLLYHLVARRAYDGGTIGKSRDWQELGPNGEDWRKLCIALLDTHAPAEQRDLEKILPAVRTWTARPKKNKLPLLIAASVLLLLGAGIASVYFLTRPPKLDFNPHDWEKLCLAYHAWFDTFSASIAEEPVRKRLGAEPYPQEVIRLFNNAKVHELYPPKKIANFPGDIEELAQNPTMAAKTGYGPYYTQEAVKFIDTVSAALTPEHWPLLNDLQTKAQSYQQRGWEMPAAGIRAIISAVRPPEIPLTPPDIGERMRLIPRADVLKSIDDTVKAAASVQQIDARWTRIEAQLQKLPAGDARNVPLIAELPRFAREYPRSQADPGRAGSLEDVTALAAAFERIEQVIDPLVVELNKPGQDIDYGELAKDPAVQLTPEQSLTPESFAGLPSVAADFVRIADDPRGKVDWQNSLAHVQSQFIAVITEANREDPNLPVLIAQRDALQKQITDWAAIAPIARNRQRIETLVAQATDDLAVLTRRGGEWVLPYIVDPVAYIAAQQERLSASPLARATPVVYSEWQKAHRALLAKAQAAPDELKNYTRYRAIDAKFTRLEEIFAHFDTKIPTEVPGLSTFTDDDWRRAVAARVATVYRQDALKDLMTNAALKWADDLPLVTDAAYESYQRQRLAEFENARTDALRLIGDFTAMIQQLDRLQLLAGEAGADAPGWRDLQGRWVGPNAPAGSLLADAAIAGAVKPLIDRVNALLASDAVTDYRALVTGTASPMAEIALTSWRKLGQATLAEDLPVLEDEEKAQAAITAHLARLGEAAQRDKLRKELDDARPMRWRRWAATLTSAAAIQRALDQADAFHVTLTGETDPAMFYNRTLYSLRKEFEKNLPEAQLKPIAQAFIDAVKNQPAGKDQEIQDLLTRMEKSLSSAQEESSSAGAGPKLAGWEEETPQEGLRVFYFPTRANARHRLEFVRMQVANKTVFLCTTEVSAGLFFDTVNASGKFADLDNTGKPANRAHWFKVSDDPWNGPRVWRIADRKFSANTNWLFRVPQMGENPYYPQQATPAAPAADMPMQYLSPWSAMYVAQLLGCRLPTSDEWLAAYDRFEARQANAPRDAWNLRGEAWTLQQEHARRYAASGMKFPDDGIFLTPNLLFATPAVTEKDARPWSGAALARIAPDRVSNSADAYKGSVIWFRKVGAQPGVAAGGMHDLAGNVAEYVFDGTPDKPANTVIKSTSPGVADIDTAIATQPITDGRRVPNLFVIGGSSLSPPEMPFNVKQPLDINFAQAATGFSDVGFRLSYTAPIDSIVDVLASAFKDPRYLPGAGVRQ